MGYQVSVRYIYFIIEWTNVELSVFWATQLSKGEWRGGSSQNLQWILKKRSTLAEPTFFSFSFVQSNKCSLCHTIFSLNSIELPLLLSRRLPVLIRDSLFHSFLCCGLVRFYVAIHCSFSRAIIVSYVAFVLDEEWFDLRCYPAF